MSEIPLAEAPRLVTDAAHDAARGQVVYLTEHGERLAAAGRSTVSVMAGGSELIRGLDPGATRQAGRMVGIQSRRFRAGTPSIRSAGWPGLDVEPGLRCGPGRLAGV